ncbi:GtrA family protein [Chromatium okenii]|jgi:putative flippase GtrA|uniref:GtrA family protein n=1 Tax=Chromatium okenii TaxID=61644 RepID=UPI0026E92737|nr:GtrA family protein [Chromatium okenii]MBV5308286.1 GtrA family protein [Chromatium okenii]
MRKIFPLYFSAEFRRYLAVTILSATLSIGLPIFFHEVINILEEVAVALSFAVVLLVNFFTVRYFVFAVNGSVAKQVGRFIFSSMIFRALEYVIFLLIFSLMQINYILAIVITLSLSLLVKFYFQKFFVFEKLNVD